MNQERGRPLLHRFAACLWLLLTFVASADVTAQMQSPGAPKYGDYNGLACAGGYAFAAWTTATAPTAGAPAGMNVWVRSYQADLEAPPFSKWRQKAAVRTWWKEP